MSRVLDGGLYVLGPEVEAFEREFAGFVGRRIRVGVASGTDALTLALAACGVGPGDEVMTAPTRPWRQSPGSRRAGATPVLADIDPATIALPAARARRSARTRAIVPVHLYGGAADRDRELADAHGLRLIEDCAQAHGTRLRRRARRLPGRCATFSFYPTKNLGGVGDGGAVVTPRTPTIADRLRALRQYGWRLAASARSSAGTAGSTSCRRRCSGSSSAVAPARRAPPHRRRLHRGAAAV